MQFWRALLATVIATGVLAITSEPATAGGGPPDPCSLLTERQVGDLLGEPVGEGQVERGRGARECTWDARRDGTGGIEGSSLRLSIAVITTTQARDDFAELVRDQENELLDGIGEEAVADGTFATPVTARVGRLIYEVDISNFDTTEWDGDPRAIVAEGATMAGRRLARRLDRDPGDMPPVEQPEGIPARFADDIPVPTSFRSLTVFGTEYDGAGSFVGNLSIEETAAAFEQALADAGYEVEAARPGTDFDGNPVTIVAFADRDRTGEVEISPHDGDPPGATFVFVSYNETQRG